MCAHQSTVEEDGTAVRQRQARLRGQDGIGHGRLGTPTEEEGRTGGVVEAVTSGPGQGDAGKSIASSSSSSSPSKPDPNPWCTRIS